MYDNHPDCPDLAEIYLDGSQLASTTAFCSAGLLDTSDDLNVGSNAGSAPFDGRIDEVRFSDTARYSGSSYVVPTSPFSSDANTMALWHFAEAGGWTETAVYDRDRLKSGATFTGPAIVEQADSTTVVPPGASANVDRFGNLVIDVRGMPRT